MSVDQNKAIVRRFITEVLEGGKLDVIDELLAPNYKNDQMGGMDLAAFKGVIPMMAAGIPGRSFELNELVGEGDAVVARFVYHMTLASGEKIDARGITYYRLADGKIVEDDPLTSPDLAQILGPVLQAPAAH